MTEPEPLRGPLRPRRYPVVTERLQLRPIDPVGDVDAMHAYRCREDVCRYIPPEPANRAQVAERLASPEFTRSELEREGQNLSLAVVLRETGVLIGDVVFMWHSARERSGEIGYIIHPDYHGRGYATEAARALLGIVFDDFGMRRVTARIDVAHRASGAVLTRLGMRREALLVENEWFKGAWGSEIDYAILDHEWRAQRAVSPAPGSAADPVATWSGVTVDCLDPMRVAHFWSRLLGREAGPSENGWVYLGRRGDALPRLVFQPVPEPRQGKVRIHLDLSVDDLEAAMSQVERLGGSFTGERHDYPDGVVVVMADPEGHEFCLVQYARPASLS